MCVKLINFINLCEKEPTIIAGKEINDELIQKIKEAKKMSDVLSKAKAEGKLNDITVDEAIRRLCERGEDLLAMQNYYLPEAIVKVLEALDCEK